MKKLATLIAVIALSVSAQQSAYAFEGIHNKFSFLTSGFCVAAGTASFLYGAKLTKETINPDVTKTTYNNLRRYIPSVFISDKLKNLLAFSLGGTLIVSGIKLLLHNKQATEYISSGYHSFFTNHGINTL